MQFFTSAKDLGDWVRHQKTPDEAAKKIIEIVGNSERDIVETCRSMFKGDENASNILFGILAKHNLTREGRNMTNKIIKEAQIIGRDAPLYANMELKVCPKLPYSVGKRLISTYNCRNQCLDSLVLDDDPNRTYCLEALWRRHVMDKFSREFKDKDGKWVGGYINERFQTFKDDGGNQMQLAHGERTRLPRPHQYSTESRLSEGRGEEITFQTASSNKFVKLASVDTKEATKVDQIFSDVIEMKEAGLSDEDIIYKVAEHYNETIQTVAVIHKAATKSLITHSGIVYAHNNSLKKNAQIAQTSLPPKSTVRALQDINVTLLNGQESILPVHSVVVVEPEKFQNKTVFNHEGSKFCLHENTDANTVFEPLDSEHGLIQDAAEELALNEEIPVIGQGNQNVSQNSEFSQPNNSDQAKEEYPITEY